MIIVKLEADVASWATWAMEAGIQPEVIGCLRWRPELLAAKEVPAEGAFCSPRAWERVSHILGLSTPANVERELLIGTIGEGPATEFSAYLKTYRELPALEAIIAAPDKATVPTSPALQYAITTALSQYTKEKQISAMPYMKRLPATFGLLYIRDIRDKYKIGADKDIRSWIAEHKSLFTDEDK